MNKIIFKIFLILFTFFSFHAESKILSIGNSDAKVTVKVFSSLTCPHCADFHISIYENLKKDFIDKGLVKFEHHAFPLDLAALNAEIIVRCHVNNDEKLETTEVENETQDIDSISGTSKQKSIFEKFTEKLKKFLENAE